MDDDPPASQWTSSKRQSGAEKQLKRVRQLDNDSSDDDQPSVAGTQVDKEVKGQERASPSQPSAKRIRKWIDSDSECEASGGEDGGESESEEEGQLTIDLREEATNEDVRGDICSPVQDTVDLLPVEGGREMERGGECGSMATLELAETVHHDLDLSEE